MSNSDNGAVRGLMRFVVAACLAVALVRFVATDLPSQVVLEMGVVLAAILVIARNREAPKRILAVVIVSVIVIELFARLAPRGAMPLRYLF
jgi:hypothetical protein